VVLLEKEVKKYWEERKERWIITNNGQIVFSYAEAENNL